MYLPRLRCAPPVSAFAATSPFYGAPVRGISANSRPTFEFWRKSTQFRPLCRVVNPLVMVYAESVVAR